VVDVERRKDDATAKTEFLQGTGESSPDGGDHTPNPFQSRRPIRLVYPGQSRACLSLITK
jgi:hypothetical protein